MSGRLRRWWRDHWELWTCLRGWSQIVCIADDLAHMLHLPARWLCDLHDRRLMRVAGHENDLHDSTIKTMWDDAAACKFYADPANQVPVGPARRRRGVQLNHAWNASTNTTTTLGDVKITYRTTP